MLITLAIHFCNQTHKNGILHVWNPDTDVLFLLIYFMSHLLQNTFLFWQDKTYDIFQLYSHIGRAKAQGLLAWHAVTGLDTTGKFARHGKKTWWHLFMDLDDKDDKDIINSLQESGKDTELQCQTERALARFITLGYAKGTNTLPAVVGISSRRSWEVGTKFLLLLVLSDNTCSELLSRPSHWIGKSARNSCDTCA